MKGVPLTTWSKSICPITILYKALLKGRYINYQLLSLLLSFQAVIAVFPWCRKEELYFVGRVERKAQTAPIKYV